MSDLEYTFNQEHNLMGWHHRCPLDIEYMLKLIKDLHKQEAARAPFNRFVDLSQVESISLSYHERRDR